VAAVLEPRAGRRDVVGGALALRLEQDRQLDVVVPVPRIEGVEELEAVAARVDHHLDAGRIGGLTPAKLVADYAHAKGVQYVNHTFTSHLALSASLQPYAGLHSDPICEYPADPKPLAWEVTREHLVPDADGRVHLPDAPGLGLVPDPAAIRKYLVQTEIAVRGKVLYRTPEL